MLKLKLKKFRNNEQKISYRIQHIKNLEFDLTYWHDNDYYFYFKISKKEYLIFFLEKIKLKLEQ